MGESKKMNGLSKHEDKVVNFKYDSVRVLNIRDVCLKIYLRANILFFIFSFFIFPDIILQLKLQFII